MSAAPMEAREFVPNSWAQQEAFWDTHTEMLYSGALGTAKTRTACERADYRCRMYPGAVVGLCRRYRTDLGRTTLVTLFRDVISEGEKAYGWSPSAEGGSTLFYPNGSRLLAFGCDSIGPIRGTEFDLIVMDQAEEADEELWVELLSRCRHRHGPFQGLSGYCNPDSPAHFLYRRFRIDLGNNVIVRTTQDIKLPTGETIRAGHPLRRFIMASPGDNAQNLTQSNLITLETMTGVQRERLKEGRWVMPFGLVYPEYHPGTHVIERPSSWAKWGGYPPPDWPRLLGVDFGFKNPTSLLWLAVDPDDRMFAYREWYAVRRTAPEIGRVIVDAEAAELAALRAAAASLPEAERMAAQPYLRALNVQGRYRDHDASEAASVDEVLEAAGLAPTELANKAIDDGLNRVRRRLSASDGRVSLYFLRDLAMIEDDGIETGLPRSILEEFPRYQYPKGTRSDTTSQERLDVPIDRDNHGLAALRYPVATYETEARISVR